MESKFYIRRRGDGSTELLMKALGCVNATEFRGHPPGTLRIADASGERNVDGHVTETLTIEFCKIGMAIGFLDSTDLFGAIEFADLVTDADEVALPSLWN